MDVAEVGGVGENIIDVLVDKLFHYFSAILDWLISKISNRVLCKNQLPVSYIKIFNPGVLKENLNPISFTGGLFNFNYFCNNYLSWLHH